MTAKAGFVDTFVLETPTSTTTDSEGRTTRTMAQHVVVGRVAMVSFTETARASSDGEQYDAVALMPHGTPVALSSRVVVNGHAESWLDGTYEVSAVRTNRLHLRVLMRRWSP